MRSEFIEEVVDAVLRGEKFRRIVLKELHKRALLEFGRLIEIVAEYKEDAEDWWRRRLIENRRLDKEYIIRFGALAEKTIANIRRSTKKDVCIEESSLAYDVIKNILSEIREKVPELSLKIRTKSKEVSLDSHDTYRLLLAISSAFGGLRGGIWSEVGKRAGQEVLKRIFDKLGIPDSPVINPKFYYELEIVSGGREIDAVIYWEGKPLYRIEIKLLGHGNPEIGNEAIARKCNIFLVDDLTDLMRDQAKRHGVKVIFLKDALDELYKEFKGVGLPVEKPNQQSF